MKEGWEIKKLGDCFDSIKNGANIKQERGAAGIPITRIETLSGGVFNRDRLGYANILSLEKYASFVLDDGDLLLSHINSKTYIGRTVVYNKLDNEVIIHGMNLLRLKAIREILSPYYAYYCFKSELFKDQVASYRKDAVNQSSIPVRDLKKIKIPVPPIAEQEKIVAELDCLSGIIEKKKQQLKEYDALAQSIFYEMFGSENNTWDTAKLIDIYKFIDYRGKTPNKISEGIPLITAKNIRKGYIDYSVREYISEKEFSQRQSRGIAKKGDLLFTTEAPMGYVAIADLDVFSTGQRLITFQKKHSIEVNNTYVLYYLLSECFQSELNNQATGATVKGIKGSKLEQMKIDCPPLALQQEFASKIEAIEMQKELIKKSIEEVETLFNSRMNEYFN